MQVDLHPDVSKLVQRYGRWHHDVDYSGFRHKLKRREGVEIPSGDNEYGMIQEEKVGTLWIPLVGGK